MMEMMMAISKAGGYKPATCIWYIQNSILDSITPCALFLRGSGEIWMDNLPTDGYLNSRVDESLLNNQIFILKHLPVDYPRAVFWSKDKEILYVDFKDMNQYKCRILSRENRGYYCIFKVHLEDFEEPQVLRVSDYAEKWIFLDPES